MNDVVLDSSAVLALLLGEAGAEAVQRHLPGALMSAVNLAETVSKLAERGMPPGEAYAAIAAIGIEPVGFDADQAIAVGALRIRTREAGLSLGDRACLALAEARGLPAVTADTAWQRVPGVNVVIIRGMGGGA